MAEERIPTFIPGDEVIYQIVFTCPVNIRTVTAAFRNETTGAEITLTGAAQLFAEDKARVVGTRTHVAKLFLDEERSEMPDPGRYRIARLEAQTYKGTPLDFDNPIEEAFRFEDEPEDIALPVVAQGVVDPPAGFVLPAGHPNKFPIQ